MILVTEKVLIRQSNPGRLMLEIWGAYELPKERRWWESGAAASGATITLNAGISYDTIKNTIVASKDLCNYDEKLDRH